jgi:hypothetical protein
MYMEYSMGIVNIDDELHDQIRKASAVSCRSINAQAAFWIKIGMLCEMSPTQSFNEIVAGELRAAGVAPHPLKTAAI